MLNKLDYYDTTLSAYTSVEIFDHLALKKWKCFIHLKEIYIQLVSIYGKKKVQGGN